MKEFDLKITRKFIQERRIIALAVISVVFATTAIAQTTSDPNYVPPSEISLSCGNVKLAYGMAVSNGFETSHPTPNKPEKKSEIINSMLTLSTHPIIKKLITEAVDRGYYDGKNGAGIGFTHQMGESFEGKCRNIVLDNNDKIEIHHSGE
ncbi:hypothetical protein [Burkholderia multivorans]|uniref:hypothetical protein n=1 Tax=Burkholderia multivorans TaxID=87883 RepID=UPI0021C10556|nr:hypothetical protein [Burkholderia multivorans]